MQKRITLLLIVLISGIALAQDVTGYVELLKQDLKTKKIAIVTEGMNLSEEDSQKFWPLYKEFDAAMDKLFDKNLKNIKDYANHFEKMTNEKAREIGERALKIDQERLELEQKYLKKISDEMSAIVAVRFLQIYRQISFLLRLQINAQLPLIEKAVDNKKTM